MKRFHAAGICDCCDAPPEDEPDENPNYGPGNPDGERDFERDVDIGTCQSCGRYHDLRVRTCPCGGYVG